MSLFSKTPTKAAAALADAEQVLARWVAEVEAKGAELADLQGRAGVEALDDPTAAGRLAEAMHRLGTEQDVARRAVLAAGERVVAARRVVLRARAADLRSRASRLAEVAATRQAKTDRLLAELKEHEGPDYVPWEPGSGAALVSGPQSYKVPLTGVIVGQAKRLEHQAAELDRLAAEGSPEQVAHQVGAPVPEPSTVEREFAGVR